MLRKRHLALMAFVALLAGCGTPAPAPQQTAIDFLRRGVNLGNCLEAPAEGEWGYIVQKDWFRAIREAGFDHVRIPVRWSAHAGKEAPYTIEESFLQRVDDILGWALEQELAVVLNTHHYSEYCQDPAGERQRLHGIWEQLAEHYKNMPGNVVFELFNEPNGNADPVFYGDAATLIGIVRKTNPDRWIIVDAIHWANVPYITKMKLPADDRLIASVHLYEPMEFTHQGAEWMEGYDRFLGVKWEGTAGERQKIDDLLDIAATAGKRLGVPVYLGEFGAYGKADYESRLRWTSHVAQQCEQRDLAWAYWEFCAGFGMYDSVRQAYDEGLLRALIPDET